MSQQNWFLEFVCTSPLQKKKTRSKTCDRAQAPFLKSLAVLLWCTSTPSWLHTLLDAVLEKDGLCQREIYPVLKQGLETHRAGHGSRCPVLPLTGGQLQTVQVLNLQEVQVRWDAPISRTASPPEDWWLTIVFCPECFTEFCTPGPAWLVTFWVGFTRGFNLVWKDFRRSLVQPLPQAGPALGSDWAAQGFAQVGLENQGCTLHNLTGQWLNPAKDGQGQEGRGWGGVGSALKSVGSTWKPSAEGSRGLEEGAWRRKLYCRVCCHEKVIPERAIVSLLL